MVDRSAERQDHRNGRRKSWKPSLSWQELDGQELDGRTFGPFPPGAVGLVVSGAGSSGSGQGTDQLIESNPVFGAIEAGYW